MKRYYLYQIRNKITGRIYVGITHDPKARFKAHFERSSNEWLRLDLKNRGPHCFDATVRRTLPSLRSAQIEEIKYIEHLRSKGVELYNSSDGGEHPWSHDVRLENQHLRVLIRRVERQMKREVPDRIRERLLAPHVPLAKKLEIDKAMAKRKARDDAKRCEGLEALLRFVRSNLETAYGGTDRMTSEEQAEWRAMRGPVLKLDELEWRLAVGPAAWHDRDEWLRAFPRIAPGSVLRDHAA
jgi:hypothetical protein